MDGDVVTAIVTVVVAFVVAELVDRTLARRGKTLTGGLSPVANTRLRLIRRLIFAVILLIGAMLALSQFDGVKRVATGVLASSAVLGLVVGFAARQTLANGIAGILLAITQPIRIGDLVTFEGESGTVEDIRLTYTFIRKANDTRLVVPNERLAQSTIENHTIVDPRVRVEVELWLPPSADAVRALAVLGAHPELDVEIAQVDRDGVKLTAATWAQTAAERGSLAARVRASCLESLRSEGLAFTPE
jgi:small-conductance mechanosensitive channel